MKLTYVIQVYKSIFPMKNGLNSINILYTSFHKSFPIQYTYGKENLKRILTYLYCTKYNEINAFHLVIQKYVSYTGSHKRFLMQYGLCFEMAGNVFSIVLNTF